MDMMLFLVEAFAYNKHIWPDIDRLYQSNKYKFYNAAKESKYYNHKLLCEGDIYKQEYGRRILGILIYLEKTKEEKLNEELIKITEKGWPHIHKYIQKKEKVIFEDYIQKFIKPEMPVNKINTDLTILYTIARIKGKEIVETKAYKSYTESIINRTQNYEALKRNFFDTLPNELKEKIIQFRKRIEEKYKRIGDFDEIYDNPMLREEADIYALIADTEGLNLTDLFENIKLTKKEILELLGIYYITYKNQNTENTVKFLIPAVIIKSLLKAYNKVKEHYFQNNKETMFLEVQKQEDLIKQLGEENETLKEKVKILESQIKALQKEGESRYIERIRALEKEIQDMKKEMDILEQNGKELFALRELMFSLDRQETYIPVEEESVDLSRIKGVLIGGQEQWHKKIREYLPFFMFINTENFDIKLLDNADIVIIFPNFLSHKLYYKVINEVRKKKIPIGYISSLNEDLAVKQIKEIILRHLKF